MRGGDSTMNKSQLRPLVLEVLQRNPERSMGEVEEEVACLAEGYVLREDDLVVREIIWDLLVQGIVAPGIPQNLDFPWIHVTEYGAKCLDVGAILPHDPDGYMCRVEQVCENELDGILKMYVEESLGTFLSGHYLASTVMLGVASERCIDLLTAAYTGAISDQAEKQRFVKKVRQAGRSVKARYDVLRKKLLSLALPSELKDALEIHLSGIFTTIRYSRNDAGHPTGRTVERDEAYAILLQFVQYCRRGYQVMHYLESNNV